MFKRSKIDNDLLKGQKPKIELRSKNKVKFKHTFTNKTKVQNSPLYRGIFLWDQVPSEIQLLDDIAIFKRNICLLLVNGQIKFLKINTKINNLPTVF